MHSYLHKKFILVKSGCYTRVGYDTGTEFLTRLEWGLRQKPYLGSGRDVGLRQNPYPGVVGSARLG
jgi:hypothetical protein